MKHLRLAWRSLRRRTGYAAMSVLILALGIGTSTAIYTVASAVFLAPLPYAEPDRVVFLWDTTPDTALTNLSPARLVEFRSKLTGVTLAGVGHLSVTMTGRGLPERLSGTSVSANFFDVLGVRPLHGRVFHAGERDRQQVVLGEALWRRRFGGDPAVVGQALVLDGRPTTVVGVMPASFYWPTVTTRPNRVPDPELWLLAPVDDLPALPVAYDGDLTQERRLGYLRAVGRLATGVSRAQARAEASAVSRQMAREHPDTDRDRDAVFVPARQQLLGHVRLPVILLICAAALVLGGSCANAANLQLMRDAARARDLRVHAALGASRGTLAVQLLAEAAIVTGMGAVVGTAIATFAVRGLRAVAPLNVPRMEHTQPDAAALAFTVAVTLACALVIALVPLVRLRRGTAISPGERGATSRVSARTSRLLVGAEVATAVVLVCGALLFGRSLARVERVDVGMADVDRLVTFEVVQARARRGASPAEHARFYEQVLDRIRAVPGVRAASAAATLPIGGDDFGTTVIAEGGQAHRRARSSRDEVPAGYQVVGPGWFTTLGIPVLKGRGFTAADTGERGRVALVNQALSERLWPEGDAVGRRIKTGADDPWLTVVGVVGNIRHLGPKQPPRPELYEPMSQAAFSFTAVAVRVTGDPLAYADVFRRQVASVDAGQPISNVKTMGEHLRVAQAESRALWALTALFGWLAVAIAALGIYGALGFSVAQRMREFGVRLALGAAPGQVGRAVLRESLSTAAAGVLVGLLLAVAGARGVQALLFDTTPLDPIAYAGAAAALAIVAAVAGFLPARSATRADPAAVLRSE